MVSSGEHRGRGAQGRPPDCLAGNFSQCEVKHFCHELTREATLELLVRAWRHIFRQVTADNLVAGCVRSVRQALKLNDKKVSDTDVLQRRFVRYQMRAPGDDVLGRLLLARAVKYESEQLVDAAAVASATAVTASQSVNYAETLKEKLETYVFEVARSNAEFVKAVLAQMKSATGASLIQGDESPGPNAYVEITDRMFQFFKRRAANWRATMQDEIRSETEDPNFQLTGDNIYTFSALLPSMRCLVGVTVMKPLW